MLPSDYLFDIFHDHPVVLRSFLMVCAKEYDFHIYQPHEHVIPQDFSNLRSNFFSTISIGALPFGLEKQLENINRTSKHYICVLDYDMKGMGIEDFYFRWGMKPGEKVGNSFEETHKNITSYSLEDCEAAFDTRGFAKVASRGKMNAMAVNGRRPTQHFVYFGARK